jgi:transposase
VVLDVGAWGTPCVTAALAGIVHNRQDAANHKQAPCAGQHRWAWPRTRSASSEHSGRDGSGPLLRTSRRIFPLIQRVFANGGYAGEKVAKVTLIAVEIVRKNPNQVGFAVNPRRWVVERLFAWIGRNRRLAKDFEATIDSARAFLYAVSVMLLVRRIVGRS